MQFSDPLPAMIDTEKLVAIPDGETIITYAKGEIKKIPREKYVKIEKVNIEVWNRLLTKKRSKIIWTNRNR